MALQYYHRPHLAGIILLGEARQVRSDILDLLADSRAAPDISCRKLAPLPRAGSQPGTSENSVTLILAKLFADRGKMTQNRQSHFGTLLARMRYVIFICSATRSDPSNALNGFKPNCL